MPNIHTRDRACDDCHTIRPLSELSDDAKLAIARQAVKEWLEPDYGCNFVEHCVALSLLRLLRELADAKAAEAVANDAYIALREIFKLKDRWQ